MGLKLHLMVLSKGSPMADAMHDEVNKSLLLFLTFPVTTFIAERSFSSLCRINA